MYLYEYDEGIRPWFVCIREELHDKTDQEAGDIEWQWADRLGYKRGVHYTISVNAVRAVSRDQHIRNGKKSGKLLSELGIGIHSMTPEQKFAAASKGGKKAAALGKSGFQVQTFEQRSAIGKKGGAIAGRKAADLSLGFCGMTREQRLENAEKGGCAIRTQCPHCGLESTLMILKRWHFDNCPRKPRARLVRRAP